MDYELQHRHDCKPENQSYVDQCDWKTELPFLHDRWLAEPYLFGHLVKHLDDQKQNNARQQVTYKSQVSDEF